MLFMVCAVLGLFCFWFVLFLAREPKTARTKKGTNQKGHEPKRTRTKKGTNQKEREPKRSRTKIGMNQKQHKTERA